MSCFCTYSAAQCLTERTTSLSTRVCGKKKKKGAIDSQKLRNFNLLFILLTNIPNINTVTKSALSIGGTCMKSQNTASFDSKPMNSHAASHTLTNTHVCVWKL